MTSCYCKDTHSPELDAFHSNLETHEESEKMQTIQQISNSLSTTLHFILTCLHLHLNSNATAIKYCMWIKLIILREHYCNNGSMMRPAKCFHKTVTLSTIQCSVKGSRKMKICFIGWVILTVRLIIYYLKVLIALVNELFNLCGLLSEQNEPWGEKHVTICHSIFPPDSGESGLSESATYLL